MQKYIIVEKQVKAINILIKLIETSIERNTFNDNELEMIYKTVEILNLRYLE